MPLWCLQDFVIMTQPMNTIIYFWATYPLNVDAIFECLPWLLDFVQRIIRAPSRNLARSLDNYYIVPDAGSQILALKSFILMSAFKKSRLFWSKEVNGSNWTVWLSSKNLSTKILRGHYSPLVPISLWVLHSALPKWLDTNEHISLSIQTVHTSLNDPQKLKKQQSINGSAAQRLNNRFVEPHPNDPALIVCLFRDSRQTTCWQSRFKAWGPTKFGSPSLENQRTLVA